MWHLRDNTRLVEPGDMAFWKGLWRTDAFKELFADESTDYPALLRRAASMPWWLVDIRHDYERRHFSVWFGQAIMRREYDNPVITDLFYWHEILHGLTFRILDDANMNDATWRASMRANEIAVSMETEMVIYWRKPGLRQHSFDFPIWFDSVANGLTEGHRARLSAYLATLGRDPTLLAKEDALADTLLSWPLYGMPAGAPEWKTLWDLRRATTHSPAQGNKVEAELARYEATADPYYATWGQAWRRVETERRQFHGLISQGCWKRAVDLRHRSWEETANTDGVP